MFPSDRSELRTYAAREWNADVAFLMKDKPKKGRKERAKKIRTRREHPSLVGLKRLLTGRARAHR